MSYYHVIILALPLKVPKIYQPKELKIAVFDHPMQYFFCRQNRSILIQIHVVASEKYICNAIVCNGCSVSSKVPKDFGTN